MSTIINATTTNGVVIQPDNSGSLVLQTNSGTTALTIDTSQNVGIGTTSPANFLDISKTQNAETSIGLSNTSTGADAQVRTKYTTNSGLFTVGTTGTAHPYGGDAYIYQVANKGIRFATNDTERMRVTSNGDVLIGKTGENDTTAGIRFAGVSNSLYTSLVRDGNPPLYVNRLTSDGALVQFAQANTVEGTISVSGTTVSYGGGHIARWSQLYNETTKVEVYRGTVLESVDAMCEWYRDGQLLPNEQATKTIISTTVASKKIAGVFDIYDEDDEVNPYDFFVAQSGDFVIRIAQGVTVQNGDLLESAGDGTAKPQADDICRSSTIAKVTSNYVSVTYEDGSYCVPCILMIG